MSLFQQCLQSTNSPSFSLHLYVAFFVASRWTDIAPGPTTCSPPIAKKTAVIIVAIIYIATFYMLYGLPVLFVWETCGINSRVVVPSISTLTVSDKSTFMKT